jgi:hypothetical protein
MNKLQNKLREKAAQLQISYGQMSYDGTCEVGKCPLEIAKIKNGEELLYLSESGRFSAASREGNIVTGRSWDYYPRRSKMYMNYLIRKIKIYEY